MTPAGRGEALEVLRTMPRHVENMLRGSPRPLLLWAPAPGKWCIAEVLAHWLDVETDVYLAAYLRAAAGADVEADRFDPDARALARGTLAEPPHELLRAWKRARREALSQLDALPETRWSARVTQAGTALDLEEFVAQHAAHDRAHARQIEGILERHALLGRLAAMPGELSAVLELSVVPLEGVRQAIACLGDFERRMLAAYARIVEQDRPQLFWLEAAAAPPGGTAMPLSTVRRDFERLRSATHALLYACGPRLWQRRGIDPRLGERTLADLVARHLDHDAQCLAALREILTCSPAASPPR